MIEMLVAQHDRRGREHEAVGAADGYRRRSPAPPRESAEGGWVGTLLERFLRDIITSYRAKLPCYLCRVLTRYEVVRRWWKNRSPAKIARNLLAEHLSPEQLREMDFKSGFTVTGGQTGVRYLIAHGRIRNVHVVDKHGDRIANLCFGPAAPHNGRALPEGDIMLAQKIALEDPDLELEALRVANMRFSRPVHACSELQTIRSVMRDSYPRSSSILDLSMLNGRGHRC
jgi:hypothetical protein